jgi:outer membrane protein assembly factor BamB
MARIPPGTIYIGIKGQVVALDRRDGMELWRTPLRGSSMRSSTFVCVFRDGDLLFATCSGEIYCLDPKTGAVVWQNALKGLGLGFTSIAGDNGTASPNLAATIAAEVQRQRAQHTAGA